MATNFPNSLDTFENPTPTTKRNELSLAGLCSNLNDAVEALEAKVGVDNSTVQTSLDYLLKNSNSSNPGHKHTLSDGATDITASVDNLNSINQALGTGDSPTFAGLTIDTDTLYVDSSNHTVGIGTTNTGGARLRIKGTTSGSSMILIQRGSDDIYDGYLRFYKSRGTPTSPTAVSNGDRLGSLDFYGYDGANWDWVGGIKGYASAISSGDISSMIRFYTANAGTVYERVRIDDQGNVGIGATSFGTNAQKVLAIINGTEPSSSPTDTIQLYAKDLSAGNSIPYFRTENGTIIGLNQSLLTTDSPTFAGLTLSTTPLGVSSGGTGLSSVTADNIIYTSTDNTFSATSITSFGRSLIDDADAATARTTLGLGSSDSPTFKDLLLNGASIGTNGVGVLGIKNGTAPTSSPADVVQLYAQDIEAGKSVLNIRNEDGTIFNTWISRVKAYLSGGNQTIPSGVETKVELNAESYDEQGEFDPTTNHRFTAKKAGYYLIIGSVLYNTPTADKRYMAIIKKNGGSISLFSVIPSVSDAIWPQTQVIEYLDVGDYIELFTYHNKGSDDVVRDGELHTFLAIHKLS